MSKTFVKDAVAPVFVTLAFLIAGLSLLSTLYAIGSGLAGRMDRPASVAAPDRPCAPACRCGSPEAGRNTGATLRPR